MKKILMTAAALSCVIALASCGGGKNTDDTQTPDTAQADTAQSEAAPVGDTSASRIAAILNKTAHFTEELTEMSPDAVMRRYGLDGETVTNAAGFAGTPAVVDEIAVFETKDADKVMEAVNARIESQKTNYASYAPGEVPKLDDAVAEPLEGTDCIVVCVSEDPSATIRNILTAIAEDAE